MAKEARREGNLLIAVLVAVVLIAAGITISIAQSFTIIRQQQEAQVFSVKATDFILHDIGQAAQLAEQLSCKQQVASSNPALPSSIDLSELRGRIQKLENLSLQSQAREIDLHQRLSAIEQLIHSATQEGADNPVVTF